MLQNDYYLELPVSPGCPSCNSVCKVLKTTSTQGCFTDVTPILTHTGGDSNKVSRKINIVPERCIKKQSTNKSIQVRKPEKSFSQNHQSDRTSDRCPRPKNVFVVKSFGETCTEVQRPSVFVRSPPFSVPSRFNEQKPKPKHFPQMSVSSLSQSRLVLHRSHDEQEDTVLLSPSLVLIPDWQATCSPMTSDLLLYLNIL